VQGAILGGSFDPVHVAHLHIADQVLCQFSIEKVFFVPVGAPPHKKLSSMVSNGDRLAMVQEAIEGHSGFHVLDWEMKRDGPSYTIDTVRQFEQEYGSNPSLIIGDDLLPDFRKWRMVDELLERCSILVAPRAGVHESVPDIETSHIDCERLPISSSAIRRRLERGASIRFLVPERVYDYIERHRVYPGFAF